MLVDGGRRHRRAVPLRLRRQVVEDLDLERLVALDEERTALSEWQLTADEWMVRGDALGHPALDRGEIGRGQRPRQLEVVVEAVGDGRPDPELRAREQVENGLGHHVRGRVPHRVEVRLCPGVEQLVRGPALGCLEQRLVGVVHVDHRVGGLCHRILAHRRLLENQKPLVHRQDERFTPAVPPAFASHRPARSWSR